MASLFGSQLIATDSSLFLLRKYTNRLQVLFVSVFTKSFWQAPTVWAYIKQEEGAGRMNQGFCVCVCGSPATQAGGQAVSGRQTSPLRPVLTGLAAAGGAGLFTHTPNGQSSVYGGRVYGR